MKAKARGRADLLGHAAFAAAIAIIVAMAWTLYGTAASMQKSSDWSDEAIEALQAIGDVEAWHGRAEAAHAAFLLTGEERFAAERARAIDAARTHADRLSKLGTVGAGQREEAARIQNLLSNRLAGMLTTSSVRKAQGIEAAGASLAAAYDRGDPQRLRELMVKFEAEELRRLVQRRAAQAESFHTSMTVLGAAVALALAILIPGYVAFVNISRSRERKQRRVFELAEHLPAAAFQYRQFPDGSGRYEFFSRSAERLRGVFGPDALRDPEAVLGTVIDKDRAELRAALDKAGQSGTTLQHDFRVQDAEGRIRWLRATAFPRTEADGILWTGCWEDITERKRAARAMEEREATIESMKQARSRFAATVNHEIRTPLSAASGSLELLGRTRLDDDQRAALYVAVASTKSALDVVDGIADFARIEAGTVTLRPEPVSLAALFKEIAQAHQGMAREKGIALTCHVDERIGPAVLADVQRLRQILNNFLAAVMSGDGNAAVELRAELAESRDGEDVVKLSVRDTRAEAANSPLEPFVDVSAETTHRYDGSGLGFAMCQRLAQLMGGKVEASSEPGIGRLLVLTVRLPIADAQPRADAAPAPPPAGARPAPSLDEARAEGTLVLIVDDHPINRLVLLRQLNALGYAAESAADGVEALERWSGGGFSLVITDCQMPEMDGYELARAIRTAETRNSRPRVPVIGWSANALGDEPHKAAEAGMDDFMAKPVAMSDLAMKLQHWLPLPGSPLALRPKAMGLGLQP
jgi:PAS domain S-box-containing protein